MCLQIYMAQYRSICLKTIKVLVSGAGGDVAQGVIGALESSSLDIVVYKVCVDYYSPWLYKDNNSYIVPLSNKKEYIPILLKIINKNDIDVFIPTVDSEIPIISKNKDFIEKNSKAIVFVDDLDKVNICDDKFLTYSFLKEYGFQTPLTIVPSSKEMIDDFISKTTFPILSKPRKGRGSVDIITIKSLEEAYSYCGNRNVILQEFLFGDEYTTGIYIGDDNNVKGICTLKRTLKNGSTYRAERIVDNQLESGLELIAKKLGVKYLNLQTIIVNNNLVPFEFNGRFSGTTGIVSKIFNAPEMYIKERLLNKEIERVSNNKKFIAMRYYAVEFATLNQAEQLVSRSNKL